MRIFSLFRISVVLVWSFFSVVACSQVGLTPAEHLNNAKEHIDKKEFSAAAIELRNALQKEPDTLEARWLLATVAIELGDGPSAEKELRRAIQLGIVQQSAQPALIKAINLQSDWDKVIAESNRLTPGMSKADQAMILGLRGQAYLGKSDFDQAKQSFDRALKLDADASTALVGMVAFYGLQRDYDEARHWAKLAVASDTAPAEAWSALGDLDLQQEKYQDAETAYTNAIKLRNYANLDHAKRAMARMQLEKFSDAKADIDSIKQQGYEGHPYLNYVEGLGYFKQEKYPEAAESLEASYRSNPDSMRTAILLATTQLKLGNLEQALTVANGLTVAAPRSRAVKRLQGAILANRAEFADAKDILQQSLRDNPDDRMSLYMVATVSLLQGDTAQGLDYARRLSSLEPDSQPVRNLLRLAQFLSGRALTQVAANQQGEAAKADDTFGQNFLFALEAFRNQNFGDALERARLLHERYPNEVQPLNLMAACYLTLGDWVKAKAEFEKVLQIQPNEPSASTNLARIEAVAGKLEPARERLNALLEAHPNNVPAILLLAEIETQSGSPADGNLVLEQALEANPNALALRAKLAEAYFKEGRLTQVLRITQGLDIQTLKEQPGLLALRGKAQLRSGDIRAATRSLELWTRAAPESAEARFFLAEALTRSGKYENALQALQQSIQLSPGYLPARVGEVKLLVKLDDTSSAQAAMDEMRQELGDRPEVLGLDGWLAMIRGDFAAAVERFAAAAKQKPDTELTLYWAQTLWLQKKQDEALKVLQDWLTTHPGDLTVLRYLAETYLSINRTTEAKEVYEKIVGLYPNHVQTLNNLAWLVRDDNRQQAIAYAERAYELQPNNPQVLDTLGMLLLDGADASRGHGLIREAANNVPDNLQIQLHLAQSLLQQQRYSAAKETLRSIIAKAKDDPIAVKANELLTTIP